MWWVGGGGGEYVCVCVRERAYMRVRVRAHACMRARETVCVFFSQVKHFTVHSRLSGSATAHHSRPPPPILSGNILVGCDVAVTWPSLTMISGVLSDVSHNDCRNLQLLCLVCYHVTSKVVSLLLSDKVDWCGIA